MLPSLQAAERRVAEFLLQHGDDGGDLTVSAVASGSGASAGTVVRTCKSLGYQGYQQVRVLMARDRAQRATPAVAAMPVQAAATAAGTATEAVSIPAPARAHDGNHVFGEGAIRHALTLAGRMPTLMGMLSVADLDAVVRMTLQSRRILVIASGLSAPIGMSFVSRLIRCGIDAVTFNDIIDQHIAASMLDADCAAFVVSGSGANAHSLSAARACKRAGARVVAMTYFAASPLTALADVSLVLEPPDFTFGQELKDVSRVALMILTEAIAAEVERENDRSDTAFTVVSQHLDDEAD
ncbi:RpiR family transcriptional regulator [Bifidobacterium avesanii]|nr:RpiR family transcriptional regulator [Bifidobacterium avesanii]